MPVSPLQQLGRNISEFRKAPDNAVVGVIEGFANKAINDMKKNLANKGRVASGALGQSIAPSIFLEEGNLVLEIEMENYWDFINQGVNGTIQNWGSEYMFRPIAKSPSSGGETFKDSLLDWMSFKGIDSISWQNKDGEFETKYLVDDNDYNQAAFVIMRAVKRKGIEPSFFVDDVINEASITILEEQIAEAIAEELTK